MRDELMMSRSVQDEKQMQVIQQMSPPPPKASYMFEGLVTNSSSRRHLQGPGLWAQRRTTDAVQERN